MKKEDYLVEERGKVRAVALDLGIPHAEDLGQSELLYSIEHRSPEVLAELLDHLEKYREWWECALEQGSTDSSRHALAEQERESSEARLSEAVERALKS
ncbi:MAG TPA: hypothetical protein VNM67_19115 [Thermoanaerobaculia bacterium]|jgi:hypothetical protein|nr:hypothetical protein [Thermoanaerobaculia bacterium]